MFQNNEINEISADFGIEIDLQAYSCSSRQQNVSVKTFYAF